MTTFCYRKSLKLISIKYLLPITSIILHKSPLDKKSGNIKELVVMVAIIR